MEALTVFAVALATALATGLGALPFVFVARPHRRWLGIANSLASGFMLGASGGLLIEGSRFGVSRTLAGATAGMLFVWISGRFIGHDRELHFGALAGADARRALLIVGIMTLHSFAEGVGVGVAFGSSRPSAS
jgi:ZIP family zinc transporter